MKFLIDMPLSPALAASFSTRSTSPAWTRADLDYPRLLALAQAEEPGLILFRGGCFNEQHVVERLARALELVPLEELPHSIVVIEQNRIRRKRLPLAGPD